MSTRLIVKQFTPGEGEQLIADVEDYDGPLPVVGTWLFHPPLHPRGDASDARTAFYNGGIAGCVKQVLLAAYGRPQNGEDHFTRRTTNIIEVII